MITLSLHDFNFIRSLLLDYAGITLGEDKQYFVQNRLADVMRHEGFDSMDALLAVLRSNAHNHPLLQSSCESLLVAETSFFRDIYPFQALKKTILPALIQRHSDKKELNIWCAACSTGQEPYSLAILIKENFPELQDWIVNIYATDISNYALKRAREGRFSRLEVNRGLPAALLVKYFSQQGLEWCIHDDIKNMVIFSPLDLTRATPLWQGLDIVLMRNVLIYFESALKKVVLHKVRQSLSPNGYLFLGSAESTVYIDEGFKPEPFERTVCYRLCKGA